MNSKKQTLQYIYDHYDENSKNKIEEQNVLREKINKNMCDICILGNINDSRQLYAFLTAHNFPVKYFFNQEDQSTFENLILVSKEIFDEGKSIILFASCESVNKYRGLVPHERCIYNPYIYFGYDLSDVDAHMASMVSKLFDYLLEERSHQIIQSLIKMILSTYVSLNEEIESNLASRQFFNITRGTVISCDMGENMLEIIERRKKELVNIEGIIVVEMDLSLEHLWLIPIQIKKLLPQAQIEFEWGKNMRLLCVVKKGLE